jgi:hypothetical protein
MKIFEIFFLVMMITGVISAINVLGLAPYAVPLDSGEQIDVDMYMSDGTLVSGKGNSSFMVYANGTTLCRDQTDKFLCKISIQMNKKQKSKVTEELGNYVAQEMAKDKKLGHNFKGAIPEVPITDEEGRQRLAEAQKYTNTLRFQVVKKVEPQEPQVAKFSELLEESAKRDYRDPREVDQNYRREYHKDGSYGYIKKQ